MRYPVLETENLFLRKPLPQDFPAQTPGARNWYGVTQTLGHWDAQGYGPFALICKDTDLCLGLVGPWNPADHPEAELVWNLWDNRTKSAIAREAIAEAYGFARRTLGWNACVSYLGFANRTGIALAEALGATRDRFADTPLGRDCLVYRHGVPKAA
jgi:RimJ/RimL family protein N-acetyltransferase